MRRLFPALTALAFWGSMALLLSSLERSAPGLEPGYRGLMSHLAPASMLLASWLLLLLSPSGWLPPLDGAIGLWLVGCLTVGARAEGAIPLWIGLGYLVPLAVKAGLLLIGLVRRNRPGPDRRKTALLVLIPLWLHGALLAHNLRVVPVHGDEPHYLLATHSLLHDADLNQFNNYQQEDYRIFHPERLEPKPSDIITEDGIRSRGLGGLPFALLPGYALGGRAGAALQMLAAAALLAALTYHRIRQLGASPEAAGLAWAAMIASPPLLLYSGLCYPDLPAALLVTLGLLLVRPDRRISGRTGLGLIGLVLTLTWFKLRFLPLGLGLLLLAWPLLGRRARRITPLLPLGLLLLGLVDVLWLEGALFWSRTADMHRVLVEAPGRIGFRPILGLLLDQEAGLAWYGPVWLVALMGLRRRELRRAAVALPYLLVLLLHPMWHGLPTPPLRYLIPVLPLLAAPLADLWDRGGRSGRALATGSLALGAGMGLLLTLEPGLRYNLADGTARIFAAAGAALDLPLCRLLPSLLPPRPVVLPWTIGLGAGLVLWIAHRRGRLGQSPAPEFTEPVLTGMILTVGACLLLIQSASAIPLERLEAENPEVIHRIGGRPYPDPPDPYFHRVTHHRGWQLDRWASLRLPLDVPTRRGAIELTLWRECTGPTPVLHVANRSLEVPWREPVTVPLDLGPGPRHRNLRLRLGRRSLRGRIVVDSIRAVHPNPLVESSAYQAASLLAAGWPRAALTLSRLGVDRHGPDPIQRYRSDSLLWLDLARRTAHPSRFLARARRLRIPLEEAVDDPDLLRRLALAAAAQGAGEEADRLGRLAGRSRSGDYRPVLARALGQLEQGRYAQGLELLVEACRLAGGRLPDCELTDPSRLARALPDKLGNVLQRAAREGRYQGAVRHRLRQHRRAGLQALEESRIDEAAEHLSRALREDPLWTAPLLPWHAPGFDPVLERMDPGDGSGPLHLGMELRRRGRPHEAAALLLQAWRLQPEEYGPPYQLAETYRNMEQYETALAFVDAALVLVPDSQQAQALRTGLLRRKSGSRLRRARPSPPGPSGTPTRSPSSPRGG